MKRIILALLLLLSFTITTPAFARHKETVGDRLSIYFSGDQTFPAGQPFYIQHGWSVGAPATHLGVLSFEVEIDGIPVSADFRLLTVDPEGDPVSKSITWVYNFPDGMTGTHTFTGHWITPCDWVYDDCENPVEPVESYSSIVVVTFEE